MGGRGAIGKSQRKTKSESKLSDFLLDAVVNNSDYNSNYTPNSYQIQDNIEEAEKSIMNENIEHMYVFNEKGNRLYYKTSNSKINVLVTEEEKIMMNNNIVIHNHPSGNSFSLSDIKLFITSNMKELRIITNKGVKFTLKRSEKWDEKMSEDIEKSYNKLLLKAKRIYTKSKFNYNVDRIESVRNKINRVLSKHNKNWLMFNASKYGYTYSEE